jgi:hypothetical protein
MDEKKTGLFLLFCEIGEIRFIGLSLLFLMDGNAAFATHCDAKMGRTFSGSNEAQ